MGLIKIERMFPLTLGSNLGTTITGLLAALSATSDTLKASLQIAFCHTLFNLTGKIPLILLLFFKQFIS
jgi:solute carrier family 34 (sodium-dependent phosphate cotransporter)